jgi:mannose-1-phosphate guanylyltransferase
MTFDRLRGLVPPERVFVITAARFVPLVRQHLPEIPAANIVGEPMRRDTAAAVALAGLLVEKRCGPAVLALLTADHLIAPTDRFQAALRAAAGAATRENVYTFGIPPTSPATGYGYLEVGERASGDGGVAHHRVLRFHEKPDLESARMYLESGRFLWNSGMFVWDTGR